MKARYSRRVWNGEGTQDASHARLLNTREAVTPGQRGVVLGGVHVPRPESAGMTQWRRVRRVVARFSSQRFSSGEGS